MINKISVYFGVPQNQLSIAKSAPKTVQQRLKTDTFQKTSPPLKFKGSDVSKPAYSSTDSDTSAGEGLHRGSPRGGYLNFSDPNFSFKNNILSIAKNTTSFPLVLPKIGQGREYAILELSDQYIYRLPVKDEYTRIEDFDVRNFDMMHNFPTRIKSRPLAKLGGWTGNRDYISGHIHSKIKGKQGSVDYPSLSFGEPIPIYRSDEFMTKYKDYIRDMAAMPQHSYKNLIQDIKALDNADLCFEPNPNNLMVDTNAQELNLVDIDDIPHAVNKNQFPEGETNNLGYLLSMVTDMSYLNMEKDLHRYIHHSKTGRYGDSQAKLRREIMKKTLQAACTENFIKLPGPNYRLGNGHSPAFSVESMFEAADMKANDWHRVRTILERAKSQNSEQARQNASNAIGDIFDSVRD